MYNADMAGFVLGLGLGFRVRLIGPRFTVKISWVKTHVEYYLVPISWEVVYLRGHMSINDNPNTNPNPKTWS